VGLQILLLLTLLYFFEIEPGSGLSRILPVLFVGFLAHAALPLQHRLKFFLLVAVVSFGVVIGPVPTLLVVVCGAAVLGVAHLPVSFWVRVFLLLAIGAALAAFRAGLVSVTGVSSSVVRVLGSIFMFRLIIYMYELRHEERGAKPAREKVPGTIWTRVAYFFLPPNVCFLLFPLVDYRTFRRTYYDTDAISIYRKGAWLIYLGFLYLLVYRLVYYLLVPMPEQVHDLWGIVRFTTSSYLVYVRVVGQFHLVIGILCLFGFNLPPVHRFYLLAAGFTDFWRRTRIDWKDFMVKVFYYPSLVPLQRRLGVARAVILATIGVFVATWILHSYQWFWLAGDFRLTETDAVFWGVIGACVTVNSVLESRGGQKSKITAGRVDIWSAAERALKIVGMFVFMCVLWSYWSSPSFKVWISYMSAALNSPVEAYAVLVVAIALAVIAGIAIQFVLARRATPGGARLQKKKETPWRGAAIIATAAVLILARVPERTTADGSPLTRVASALTATRLNAVDQERKDRGYYETLLDEPRSAASGLLTFGDEDAENGKAGAGEAAPNIRLLNREFAHKTGDFLQYELMPSFSGTFQNHPFRTNRWGMRDDEYTLAPPPSTYRIAMLGSSIEMGSGVSAESTYVSLLENRLNAEGPGAPKRRYEVLNFGVGSYSILQNAVLADRKVLRFSPNAVLLAIHSLEPQPSSRLIREMVQARTEIPYSYLREKIQQAGLTPEMSDPEIRRRIQPFLADIQRWAYAHIGETFHRAGVPVIALLVPRADHPEDEYKNMADQARYAAEAGMLVINLTDAYRGKPTDSVKLPGADPHPNDLGHRLLAERLYEALRTNDSAALRVGFSSSAK
jgi:hypothetical protein